MIAISKNEIAARLEEFGSPLVVGMVPRLAVLIAVDLDHQSFAVRNEVENVLFEWRLASKHIATVAILAERTPKDPLRLGRLATHVLSEWIGHPPIGTDDCGGGEAAPHPNRFRAAPETRFDRPAEGAVSASGSMSVP